jgi:Cu2+-exporting ATPase
VSATTGAPSAVGAAPESQPFPCDHCGLPVPAASVDRGAAHQFCCAGCRTVFGLLQDQGLDGFYRLRSQVGAAGSGVRPDPGADRYAVFDSDWFRHGHVREHQGVAETVFLAEGIHCAACVWLLEQLPRVHPGVVSTRVGIGDGTLTVRWRSTDTTPAVIARAVAGLGYPLHPFSERQRREGADRVRRKALARVLVAGASAIATMHPSLYILIGVFTGDQDAAVRATFAWLALVASLPAVTWGAPPFYRGLRAAWRLKRMTLDANAALVIVIGWLASLWQLLQGGADLYVDAVTMFIAFLLAGRFAAQEARHRASGGMDALRSVLPTAARTADGTMVAADDLAPETEIVVAAGDRLPADGYALERAVVDESVLTGEARAVAVAADDPVWAGTVVRRGPLRLRVAAAGWQSRMGGLLRQVHQAIDDSARGRAGHPVPGRGRARVCEATGERRGPPSSPEAGARAERRRALPEES